MDTAASVAATEPAAYPRADAPAARLVIYAAVAANLAIAVSKFAAAAVTGSAAMVAEGFHSLVDTGNELLLLHGLKRSARVPDQWHPFGYGKATYFWALIVALSVFALGGGLSIYHGISSFNQQHALKDPTWNYVVLALAAVFEGYSWRVKQRAITQHGRAGESLWKTVQRSNDAVIFTVFVEDSAALVGIAVAAAGIWLSHALDYQYFDPIASMLIGGVLIGAAIVLARKTGSLLVGESIDRDQVAHLREIISAQPSVANVGRLLTMQLGANSVLFTAAIQFRDHLTLGEVEHAIATIESKIQACYPEIQHFFLDASSLRPLPAVV
jgi:cation diffusion facilitator family transporter